MKSIRLRTSIPGPRSRRLIKLREKQIPRAVFQVAPIFAQKAHGAVLEDVDGNQLIDFAGGIGAVNAGHAPLEVVRAIQQQAGQYIHTCFHVAMHEPYLQLATALNQITPGKHAKQTLLLNSGAEAVENAIKIARYATGRSAVIAFEHGYHGRTLLTLSLTSKIRPYKFGFGPFAPEIYRLPFPYLYRRPKGLSEAAFIRSELNRVRNFFKVQVAPENVAAVIFELVTGEGGFMPMPPAYLDGLVSICREQGILIIADEVQTGFARTGKLFACEHYQLVPDLMTMAKSLSSGMPLAAVTGRKEIMTSVHVGGLGGTFGGNPLSCAAALATLDIMKRQKLSARAATIGRRTLAHFKRLQRRFPTIGDVRGLGAMLGMELVKSRKDSTPHPELTAKIVADCTAHGLLLLSAGAYGNVIRTLMPLCITDQQITEGMEVIEQAFKRHS